MKGFFWLFVANFLLLGWLGSQHVEEPYIFLGQLCTAYYFVHFLIIIPLVGILDNTLFDIVTKICVSDRHPLSNTYSLQIFVNVIVSFVLLCIIRVLFILSGFYMDSASLFTNWLDFNSCHYYDLVKLSILILLVCTVLPLICLTIFLGFTLEFFVSLS
jgi:hypothetical protein